MKLYNLSTDPYTINAGDKIAQLIIQPYATPDIELVDRLDETERGDNGFGSTGKQMYIFDSREKKNDHVKAYFDKHGIAYRVAKLDVGDYMVAGGTVSVDRKQNLSELATNLMNRADHARFWREVRRAREQGIRLIVLCEHGGNVKTIKDVAGWHSTYSPVGGKSLMNEIYRVHIAYGVEFVFCSKRSTGRRIVELLTEEGKK